MSLYSAPCAVTADLNRYLAAQSADDERAEDIEARADMLMADEFAPFTASNLAEAISESDISALAALLAAGDEAAAGTALAKLSRDYWKALARTKAETDIDVERAHACPRCKGRGCRSCDEDYGRDDK